MRIRLVIGSLIAVAAVAPALGETPLGTAFAYQGQLKENGVPASGVYDLQFALYDVATGGAAVSVTVCSEDVPVTDGLFSVSVPLLFPLSGTAAFLDIQVRPGDADTCSSPAGFQPLTPRQAVTPAPIATFASAVTSNPPIVRGAIRLNPANGQFEGFNGAFWVPFTTGNPILPGNIQAFTTPGTYEFVVPEGLFALGVDVWSGGGGGGGRSSTAAATSCDSTFGGGGAGGGGGGAFIRAVIDVYPGDVFQITVGAGGAAGAPVFNGGYGELSAVVRNNLNVVRALGGTGGDRGINNMSVPDTGGGSPIPLGCLSPIAAAGGAGGSTQTPLGILLYMETGKSGSIGHGPSCNISTNPDVFCPAYGGTGGSSIPNPSPMGPCASNAGRGGNGATPGGTATAGNPGCIRLFWD